MKKLIIAMLMAAPFFPAAANLVTNGSFEATAQGSGSWSIYPSVSGWTGIGHGIEVRNNVAGSAIDGHNFVELDTTRNSSMAQTLTGDAGTYLLSFWYQARPNTSKATNGLSFSLDGVDLGSVLLSSDAAALDYNWHQYTSLVDFDGSGDLRFNAIGTSDSYGSSLDNIEFTAIVPELQIAAAVPEPGTTALVLAALAAAGLASRRRKIQS